MPASPITSSAAAAQSAAESRCATTIRYRMVDHTLPYGGHGENRDEERPVPPRRRAGRHGRPLLDRVASADDPIWPAPTWPPIRLDNGLRPGSRGGHGPIRYTVEEYDPGRLIRFRFDPVMRMRGHHELRV